MGQKVHPEGFRLGVKRKGEKVDFKSSWYSDRDFAELLGEDLKVREHIEKKLSRAGIANITIRKAAEQGEVAVDIHTARPGIVIGKGGSEVDALRGELERLTGKRVQVNVREVSRPELNAALVAESIAEQLEGRAAFRRTMKRALTSTMRSGAEGARIQCGGRLGGIEMSRTETISEGRVPLHTLDADIDYGFKEAETQRGRMRGQAKGGTEVQFGEYGLQALEASWITNRQIEAARIAMTRKIKRGGKVWINIFPHKPVTKKPAETRMGSGKGSPEGYVAVVKPGRVMFEMSGVNEQLARDAMALAAQKLPIKTRFVVRGGMQS